ncbi:MAG: ABC transporter ATP-binding protein [Clostridia bacterium]|nr:ABC transporter ATP-binding protein [Clostridia bacterium]
MGVTRMARNLEQLQKQYQSTTANGKMGGGPRGRGHGGMPGGKPKDTKQTVKRLFGYVGGYKYHFIVVFMCLIITTLTSSAGTYFLKPILDNLTGSVGESSDFAHSIIASLTSVIDFGGLSPLMRYTICGVIILGFIYVVSSLSTYIQSKIMLHISQNALEKIRGELFDKVQTLPVRFHDSRTTGELMSRFTNDVDNIGVMLDSALISVVSGSATLICTLIFMLYTNVPLTVITIVFLPIFARGGIAIGKMSRKYYRGQQAALGAVNGYIEESVTGQKVVKVFNHEDECVEEFNTLNADLREKQFSAQFYGGIMGPVMGNLNKVSYAITAGVGGILCILTHFGSIDSSSVMSLTFGGLTAFMSFAAHFSRPVNEVSMQMNSVFSALAGAERVFAVLDEQPETDSTESIELKDVKGYVELKDVTFGYNPDKVILKNIFLVAKPGHKVAFVGSTGAGKTTVTNLISRFYDIDSGTITVDGTDVSKIKRKSLRSNIAMVLQDTHLFTGTVMENIRYGRLDATDEEVIEAAKTASAHSFIMRLSDGYNTLLEGDGANLSQGQRQLLNIARAAVSKAPILILDEATSSVDTRTEKHIEHGMDRLMKNRTTFVIAHRLSTIRTADEILVLENGEIIERGNHDELLEKQGRYYELYTGAVELE